MIRLPRGPTHWSFLQVRNQVFLVWLLTHGTVASRTHPLVVFTGKKPGFLGVVTHPWYSCLQDSPTGRFYRLETRFSWCGYSPMVQLPRGPTHWSFLQVRNQVSLVWLLTHGTVASRTHPLVVFTG